MSARIEALQPVLGARDVGASVRFYARLGFACVFGGPPENERYAGVARDGLELHLQWSDFSGIGPGADRPVLRFVVDDVDRLFREFEAAGVGGIRPPFDSTWGTHEFHVRDPDGNGLQFYRPR